MLKAFVGRTMGGISCIMEVEARATVSARSEFTKFTSSPVHQCTRSPVHSAPVHQYPPEVSSPESKFRRGNNSLAAVAASVTYIARSKAVQ